MENLENKNVDLGGNLDESTFSQEQYTISFNIKGKTYMSLSPDGFYLHGKKISDDKELYEEFKKFIELINNSWSKEKKFKRRNFKLF
jgi:acid phosphatase class B